MYKLFWSPAAALVWTLLSPALAPGQELLVTPDQPLGLYQLGQTIRFNIKATKTEAAEAAFALKTGGLAETARGKVPLKEGAGQIEARLDKPGWLLAEVTVRPKGAKTVTALAGALAGAEKIRPALPRPDDFDAFWQAKLKELADVPANPRLETAPSGSAKLQYSRITLDNIRGSSIRGQLARPRAGDRFPAVLIVQWAGVYPLQKAWVTGWAADGWLALNINPHDLPIDEPEAFYARQSAGSLQNYPAIGNDDPDTSYFLRMYLSCYRAAQYLTERPDWDGRTLIVTGGSQGGMQTLVTAGLHPKVTAGLANVPAGCDLNGPQAGRAPGWPMWYWQTQGKDQDKVRNAARYFDAVNFAPRIACPVLIGVGLIDTTCPPPGIYAACNQLKGPREVVLLPFAGHNDAKGSHAPYYERFGAWKQALLKGQPAPVK